jgi:hypothetical protein
MSGDILHDKIHEHEETVIINPIYPWNKFGMVLVNTNTWPSYCKSYGKLLEKFMIGI